MKTPWLPFYPTPCAPNPCTNTRVGCGAMAAPAELWPSEHLTRNVKLYFCQKFFCPIPSRSSGKLLLELRSGCVLLGALKSCFWLRYKCSKWPKKHRPGLFLNPFFVIFRNELPYATPLVCRIHTSTGKLLNMLLLCLSHPLTHKLRLCCILL